MEKGKSGKMAGGGGGAGGVGGEGGEGGEGERRGIKGGKILGVEEVLENLAKLREWLLNNGHVGIILLSTDEYLNEYVPLYANDRYHASGFSGSTGDMLITLSGNYIYVDGRYTLQAKKEVVLGVLVREGGGMGLLEEDIKVFLNEAGGFEGIKLGGTPRILVDGRKQSKRGYDKLRGVVEAWGGILDSEGFAEFRFVNSLKGNGEGLEGSVGGGEGVVEVLKGEGYEGKISYKLNKLRAKMSEHNLDYVVLSAIDELSYIFNLRSYAEGIYSSSALGISIIGTKEAYIFLDGLAEGVKESLVAGESININNLLEYKSFLEKEFFLKEVEEDKAKRVIRVGYDGRMLSKSRYEEIQRGCNTRVELVDSGSLISHMRSIKAGEELAMMEEGFERADLVMEDAINYIKEGVKGGKELTEERVYNKIEEFFKIRGARGLSFSPIVASGKNSAYVHYTRPDRNKRIEGGELMLLDIGGYWEGGYATDLTRTFLVGGLPNREYKDIYTIVLKASIQLLSLTYPVGTKGYELNNLGQGILWSYGYSCPHGLGHGIGLNVHESPPVLGGGVVGGGGEEIEDGMVFTIEPGIYIEGVGGVRIENVVQSQPVVEKAGWLCMRLLTHAKLDGNLIDKSYLTEKELDWLNRNYALS